MFGMYRPSINFEQILLKPGCKLEDLISEEDIAQEIKNNNQMVINL